MFVCPDTITVANASQALRLGLTALEGGSNEFDLANLHTADSAAVATMLAWQRAAHKAGRRLQFQNLPQNVQSLIYTYGVEELLLADSQAA